MRVRLFNIELINDLVPVPYIATHKCKGIVKGAYDNGTGSVALYAIADEPI